MFLVWRIFLGGLAYFNYESIPLNYKDKFLGGGYQNYQIAPYVYGWANFDGEHFLSISIFGYKGLEHAFFPVYPKLIGIFTTLINADFNSLLTYSLIIGLLISNAAFLIALILLWELVRMDFSEKIAYYTIIILLLFPTSFYFGSLYSESLFLLFSVASFYFYKRGRYLYSGLTGGLSSATRLFGVLIFIAVLFEKLIKKEDILKKRNVFLLLIPLGVLGYMGYLWFTVGDPIAFYTLQKLVGEQRYSFFVLPPQIVYRYINMLTMVEITNPIYQTIILELISGLIFFMLPFYWMYQQIWRSSKTQSIGLSYIFYVIFGFLLSSLQGSFSSVPRYILVFFPIFISMAMLVEKIPKSLQILLFLVLASILSLETILFLRGYWIA